MKVLERLPSPLRETLLGAIVVAAVLTPIIAGLTIAHNSVTNLAHHERYILNSVGACYGKYTICNVTAEDESTGKLYKFKLKGGGWVGDFIYRSCWIEGTRRKCYAELAPTLNKNYIDTYDQAIEKSLR